MNINLPPPPQSYETTYFNRMVASITQAFGICVTRQEAVAAVLLQAPDGSVWKVSVDNSGNLVTDSVPLGTQGATQY